MKLKEEHTNIAADLIGKKLGKHWVQPGELEDDNYRTTLKGMQSSSDVIEKGELKCPKHTRENDLFERLVTITNHARTHKCSSYCWRPKKRSQKYDEEKHRKIKKENQYTNKDGEKCVIVEINECRMGYGVARKYDPSGENNLTRGIEPQNKLSLDFDRNGSIRYVTRRNHPRVLQQPYSFPWWNANNDTQILLVNTKGEETLKKLGQEQYEQLTDNLNASGMGGLEHYNGIFVLEEYLTGYSCKGGENSENWNASIKAITETYCSNVDNENKSIRSIMGKHMFEIAGAMSFTRDNSQFCLGGGTLKRSSFGPTQKCSVTSVSLEQLGDENKQLVYQRVAEGRQNFVGVA